MAVEQWSGRGASDHSFSRKELPSSTGGNYKHEDAQSEHERDERDTTDGGAHHFTPAGFAAAGAGAGATGAGVAGAPGFGAGAEPTGRYM